MSMFRVIWGALVVLCTATSMTSIPAAAQQGQQPDIVFIMGDSALGAPAAAFQYEWNMSPIGQRLWATSRRPLRR
jgi:hypothetical protein